MQTFNSLNAFIYSQKPLGLYCLGGDSRDRTGDLLLARQALSQLSYIPDSLRKVVGPSGLEPPTLRLSVVRSSQLSYGPIQHSRVPVPSKLNNERSDVPKRSDQDVIHKTVVLGRSP